MFITIKGTNSTLVLPASEIHHATWIAGRAVINTARGPRDIDCTQEAFERAFGAEPTAKVETLIEGIPFVADKRKPAPEQADPGQKKREIDAVWDAIRKAAEEADRAAQPRTPAEQTPIVPFRIGDIFYVAL